MNATPLMIQAIILDFDGLILDTETPLIDSYERVHADHGVPFNRARFVQSAGHADYAFDPWEAFGATADRADLDRRRQVAKADIMQRLEILPGIERLLADAAASGLRIGLASNSTHDWVEPQLRRVGLHARFEFIACREDVRQPKPEPDLYRHVLGHFGLRGHQAIAFEDSHTGSLAAKRANLFAVAIPNPSTAHHDFTHVDVKLTSLAETTLAGLIARLSGT